MAKQCNYVVQTEGEEQVIRFDWVGCPHAPSIETDPDTMSKVIDAISETKAADRIIIAEAYEYEYPREQTKLLAEIADVLERLVKEENVLAAPCLISQQCSKIFPNHFDFVQTILLNKLRKDPILAYLLLLDEMSRFDEIIKSLQFDEAKNCYVSYVRDVLQLIKSYLDKTQLIQNIKPKLSKLTPGDRTIYHEFFTPTIRPNFTLTRYMIKTPTEGELLDSYTLPGDIDVNIYDIPDKTENYYHVVPPEFKLPEDQYLVLGMARRVMISYKPSTTGFTEKTRDYFKRVGRDLISTISREQNIGLSHDEIETLSSILTRYTTGLGIMEVLFTDPQVQDIYINAPIGQRPMRLLHGTHEECSTNLIPTKEDAETMAARFRLQSGRPLDEAEPVLDTSAVTPGGRARVAVITKSLSPEGLSFAFRRHRSRPWTYPLFVENNTMSALAAGLLWFIVDGGRTMLFAGPRSSGKTSLLASTIVEIMKKYRIITVEDTLELPIKEYRDLGYNVLSLKVQSVITKLESEIPADAGIRTALRLGDSCLIIGEVRSKEARALYEAMRVGALSNVVAGTIHGDDPYGVWDRVVNDLGVPTTSFKATDFLIMPAPIRSADGMHRFRRVFTITEVGKKWNTDPLAEGGFTELMKYDPKKDYLEPTKEFIEGKSEVLMNIASKVREWAGDWDAVYDNIKLRANIKQEIVNVAKKAGNKELLEGPFVGTTNDFFHIYSEKVSNELGSLDSEEIFKRWKKWLYEEAKKEKWKAPAPKV